EMIKRGKVSIWNSVPALMEMLVAHCGRGEGRELEGVRLVMLSGDWISKGLPDQIKEMIGGVKVVSLGGATEASIWSILYEIEEVRKEWKSIPYGRPMRNQRMYVLNGEQESCPEWVKGELYIGGVGLAKGYWKDEQKSAEKFVRRRGNGERLYRTGDMGRYMRGGEIEFLGREDAQVKVGGHRIELGEIEAVMQGHEQVGAAVAVARGEERGNKRLIGYVVSKGGEIREQEMKEYMRRRLPEYMVPVRIVEVEGLPLTGNGKVDRRGLPEVSEWEEEREGTREEGGAIEEIVRGICEEVLGGREIGLEEDFFEAGGHSLQATQVMTRVREVFKVEMGLRVMFEEGKVRGIAARVEEAMRGGRKAEERIRRGRREEEIPLSYGQERIWFFEQLEPGNAAYNLPAAIRLKGKLDVEALEKSIAKVVSRHEVLRTVFKEKD